MQENGAADGSSSGLCWFKVLVKTQQGVVAGVSR